MKERYGLIGWPVSHSYSAQIHRALGGYDYGLWPIEAEALGAFLTRRAFDGINVTMPYKSAVLPYLDEVDPLADALGAVNTIVREGTRLVGYNTDVEGFKSLLSAFDAPFHGTKVLILGTGATSRTAHLVFEQAGAHPILHVSRHPKPNAGEISYVDATTAHADAQWLVNATPVGMGEHFDEQPIALAPFSHLKGVIDVIYHPLRTRLLDEAQRLGIPSVNGLSMLVAQAASAIAHFTGRGVDARNAAQCVKELTWQKENIVLIGMPGVGKSTVGRLLSESLGRRWVDLDSEIINDTGMSIPQIFARGGEAAFRREETKTLRRLANESGLVLSTGGGAVVSADNRRLLHANGRLYFLDRPLRDIALSSDRPLAPSREHLERLYAERRAIYEETADVHVKEYTEPMEAVGIIRREGLRRRRGEER